MKRRHHLSRRVRLAVLARDGYRCAYCGATSAEARLEADHIIPVAMGGDDHPSNLITSCHDCNNGKSAAIVPAPFPYDRIRDYMYAGDCHVRGCRRPPEVWVFQPSVVVGAKATRCCHTHYVDGETISTMWLGYSS